LFDLYQPLILHWLRKEMVQPQDAEDLAQEILMIVVREVRGFSHAGHVGAFRGWLKVITINRMRSFWRSRNSKQVGTGDTAILELATQLEDPESDLSRAWDKEHDDFVLQRLLELMESEFESKTIQAFRRVALLGEPAKKVAEDLQMTVGAVYVAKSVVLSRLRQEAKGLIE
jgi:RNA polymerase sigma-70 factor (ECF subfamily)